LSPSLLPSLVIAGATLADGRRVDILIAGETIAAIVPAGQGPADCDRIDATDRLAAPSFVEGHIHLDKTLLGLPWVPNQAAGNRVADRIEAERKVRAARTVAEAETGANLVRQVVASGTLHMRSHVDIDNQLGLRNLHEILKVRERFRDLVTIQIVAFPQSGIRIDPGVADLLDAAIREGADLVGGLDPAGIDQDVTGHLDAVFAVAEKHGVGVDIHLHDSGPLGAFELRQIAARTLALGLEGKVAVSHAFALGQIDDFEFFRTAEALANARVAIMTNGPGPVAMPPVKRLREAGVTVFAGSDNIRDAWSPYGDGDLLRRAQIIGYRQEFLADPDLVHAFAMVTEIPAAVLGVTHYGLGPGRRADIVLLDSGSVPEAVAGAPRGRTVIKRGRLVALEGVLTPRD